MPTTQIITIVITSDAPNDVEGYIRDSIDNADTDWSIDSAEINERGVITDLLEDEEDITSDPEIDQVEEGTTEEETETEDVVEETSESITSIPTNKEF